MSNIVWLNAPKVVTRCCPGCGWIVNAITVEMLRRSQPCPGCGDYKTDEFQIVERHQIKGEKPHGV